MRKYAIGFFLAVFVSGFSGSLFGGSCARSSTTDLSAKARYCSLAINLGFVSRMLGTDGTEFSRLYFERGLARAGLGMVDGATGDFRKSMTILDVSGFDRTRLMSREAGFLGTLVSRASGFPEGSDEWIAWNGAYGSLYRRAPRGSGPA